MCMDGGGRRDSVLNGVFIFLGNKSLVGIFMGDGLSLHILCHKWDIFESTNMAPFASTYLRLTEY